MKTVIKKSAYVVAALSITLLSVTGCNKSTDTTPEGDAPNAPAPASDQGGSAATTTQSNTVAASGQALFNANGCIKCHAISGKGGENAPDLTHVGAEAEHTAAWLVAHIKNPKTHKPRSRMPAFEGKIPEKDIQALAAYLSSLK